MSGPRDLVDDLTAALPGSRLASDVQSALGVTAAQAKEIVDAFDAFVARPLEENLRKLHGRDLAKRNPMIYTARGITKVSDWVDRVHADRETSAIEGHIGTFMEEVARIVSGGIKPGSGVDLQVQDPDGVVQLYALQSSPTTKNAGARKSDIDALKRGARPLRGARRIVELNIGVLFGRPSSGRVGSEPDITVVGSDELWQRISGIADFRTAPVQGLRCPVEARQQTGG